MKAVFAARQKRKEIKDALISCQSIISDEPSQSHGEQQDKEQSGQTLQQELLVHQKIHFQEQEKSQADIQEDLQSRFEKQMALKQQHIKKKTKPCTGFNESTSAPEDINQTPCNYLLLNPHETEVFDQVLNQ